MGKSTPPAHVGDSLFGLSSPPGVNFSTSILSPTPTVQRNTMTPQASIHDTTLPQQQSHLSAFTPVRPLLTPRETPHGSKGLVLLSPSRTITESLNSLASSTAQQLEQIWDEVGYTPQERASQLSDLLLKFRDQCEQKISEEQGVAETFRQTISDSKEEIKSLSAALKALVDPQLLRDGDSDLTLTDELANLENTLETLRSEAEEAKQDLQKCHEYLIESHQALGRKLDEKWNDIDSDLTALRREEFHEKVEEMKQEVSTRTAAVVQLLRDCQHLMKDLGIDGQADDATSFDRQIAGSLVRSKDSSFIMASKFESDTCTGIGAKAMEGLTNRASELSKEKQYRKAQLQEMGTDIAMLWEQLRIPQEEQRAFTESVKGLGMDTILKGQAELKRLKSLKNGMLGKLVAEAREVIEELWEETNASDDLRRSFEPFNVTNEKDFDDDLLDSHEEYIKHLQDRLEKMKPINRIIERREDILRERMEYEELQKDSDRLKQRGAAMAKQLMEEEKMARRIKRDLPKLTKLLEEKLDEWKESNGEDFLYNGEIYAETMERQEEEWQEYKKSEMQLKLRKKQDDQIMEENKFLGKPVPHGKKRQAKPLGDASRLGNTERGSGRNTGDPKVLGTISIGNPRERTFTS
ncbi:microtubule associated protein MAP65/ASE1 family protein [Nitzschia inconspicua]|uniref:Microtubule associated protein MAP65/ASE1 family protein n=1 Tax=Nitzschia inconspicua TaxID=303405 RepID=A0A9K3LHR2_9STRA|nr:microtubule associated protein MAP65/ASE1 family protein [Nitzschia inconspicua]